MQNEGDTVVTHGLRGGASNRSLSGIRGKCEWKGATENATVVGELLGDLLECRLDFTEARFYVLDGGKALTATVKKYAGESAAIQHCQVHKTAECSRSF
jgi:hypothetical protein